MTKTTAAGDGRFDIIYMLKNTVTGFVLTIVLLFLVSVLGVYASFTDSVMEVMVSAVTYLATGICGFRAARHTGKGGLVSGTIAGLIYAVVLYLIGSIVNGSFVPGASSAVTVALCILCGAVGGIMGINFRYKKRR